MIKVLRYILMAIVFLGCSSMDVNIDYDESYNFKSTKTFAIGGSLSKSKNTLFIDRVSNALKNDLELKKYKQTSIENADLIFVFHGSVKDKANIRTSYGFSGYRGYRYGGMAMSTTNTYKYKEGTLIVDALNPKTKKIVWRGIGVKELKDSKTPKERTQAVNEAIKKIMTKFPK